MPSPVNMDNALVEIPLGELEALHRENAELVALLKKILFFIRAAKGPITDCHDLVVDIEAALSARRQREES